MKYKMNCFNSGSFTSTYLFLILIFLSGCTSSRELTISDFHKVEDELFYYDPGFASYISDCYQVDSTANLLSYLNSLPNVEDDQANVRKVIYRNIKALGQKNLLSVNGQIVFQVFVDRIGLVKGVKILSFSESIKDEYLDDFALAVMGYRYEPGPDNPCIQRGKLTIDLSFKK